MANPSKRTPWVVEIQPPAQLGWYAVGAYSAQDEARMQAQLAAKRSDRPCRVRHIAAANDMTVEVFHG